MWDLTTDAMHLIPAGCCGKFDNCFGSLVNGFTYNTNWQWIFSVWLWWFLYISVFFTSHTESNESCYRDCCIYYFVSRLQFLFFEKVLLWKKLESLIKKWSFVFLVLQTSCQYFLTSSTKHILSLSLSSDRTLSTVIIVFFPVL